MNKREMAKHMRKFAGSAITYKLGNEVLMSGEIAAAAAAALEREADAEEKAKPKVTLKNQLAACLHGASPAFVSFNDRGRAELAAAADTLRRLDEEGGKLLLSLFSSDRDASHAAGEFIRSLGVEPKP